VIELVSSETVGIPRHRLAAIDAAMQAFVDSRRIAGISTLIAYQQHVIHFGCFGKLDLATGAPIMPDSLFRIYSLTKPIITVAALLLYEAGQLPLEAPVARWIPEFTQFRVWQDGTVDQYRTVPLERDITVWHLLTHTSGLAYGFGEPTHPVDKLWQAARLTQPPLTLQYSLPELVQRLPALPLFDQPGATWHYSLGLDVLGLLIERISGQSCTAFLHERVLAPLGMRDTSFSVPAAKLSRFGPLYSYTESDGVQVVDAVPTSPFVDASVIPSGGGGLVSSMSDFYRFMAMLRDYGQLERHRLLQEQTVVLMTTNQLQGPAFPVRFGDPWPGMGYGLGIGVDTQKAHEVGWIGISGTTAWWYPREDLILIALPQMLFDWEASNRFLEMGRAVLSD
jgi:CubicO group peptidase (beta-lactamase class C family)